MGKRDPGRKPKKVGTSSLPHVEPAESSNHLTPRFCFRHLEPGFGVRDLDRDAQASLARELEARAGMTWQQLIQTSRHAKGSETIPREAIIPRIPDRFADRTKFLCFRYFENLPMVGVRIGDTFHLVWIEKRYDEVYNHGS